MNKYLLAILQESNTIIIPGLGALTVTNKEKNEIMFMSYLKHDDGKLSSYIAEKDGIDETDAKNVIAKFVREIMAKLDQGDTYDMFQFGTFSKDGQGDIEFNAWQGTTEKTAEETKAPTPPVIPTPPVQTSPEPTPSVEKQEIQVPKAPVTPPPTPPQEDEKKDVVPVEEKKEAPTTPPRVEEVKPPVEQKEKAVVPPTTPEKEMNIVQKEEISKNREKVAQLKKQQTEKKEKKKRGAGFWMLIILLFLLAGGGTYFGLNYDSLKEHIPFLADDTSTTETVSEREKMEDMLSENEINNEPAESLTEETEHDTDEADADEANSEALTSTEAEDTESVENTAQEEAPKEEEKVETPVVQTSNGTLPYHVVAGVFSSEENAHRLSNKLQAEGLPSTVFPNSVGMYVVSMKAFASNTEASSALGSLREVSSSAWILHKP